jgi:hypothetical protein
MGVGESGLDDGVGLTVPGGDVRDNVPAFHQPGEAAFAGGPEPTEQAVVGTDIRIQRDEGCAPMSARV